MKKILLILCALLLTVVGARADVDFTSRISNTTAAWTGATGTLQTGVENYSGDAFGTGRILYQVIEGLPAGTYTVSFYAAANLPYISNASYSGSGIAQAFANSVTAEMTVGTLNGSTLGTLASETYLQTLSNVTVGDDGTLTYGIQNVAEGGQWYVAQGLSITLVGDIVTRQLDEGYVVEDEGEEDHQNHWTQTFTNEESTNGALGYNTWSSESGMTTPYHQVHVSAGSSTSPVSLSDQTIDHYQFMGLPAGYYAVTVDARVLSELDNTLSTGSAYFIANNDKVDIVELADVNEDFSYNGGTESEASGSYDIIAEVTETEGTLDIGFSITNATYNWISWKNLKVEYLGTTIEYSLGEPQCSATTVKPGEELTITFDDCITPNTDETPVLDSSKSITVNGSEVEATLTTTGLTASVTITIPDDITLGSTVAVVVRQGLLTWANSNPTVSSPTSDVTFTLSTPAMEDQAGVYLYSTHAEGFLSRGGEHNTTDSGASFQSYGKIATTDPYGIPVDITFGDDGLATVKFLDSNLFLYGGGWAWTDGSEANAGKYLVKEVTTEDEETVYQFCYDGGDDSFLYVNDENYEWVANNGNLTGDNNLQSDITRTYWQIFTMTERDAHKEAFVEFQKAEIAEAVGADDLDTYIASLPQTDVTDMVASAALAGSLTGWTETDYYTDNGTTYFSTGTWGTEIYQGDAKLVQTVEGLEEGIYKVTLQGFVRHGYADNIVNSGLDKYDLSIGFLQANDYQINLNPWATEADLTNLVPNGTGNVWGDNNDGTRTYANELYTYVGSDGSLELSINCPDVLYGGWMVFKNLTLTYYGEIEVIEYTNDVTWKLANPSFEVDNVVANLTVDTTRDAEEGDGGAWTVSSLTGWDLAAPTHSTESFKTCDIMSAEARATDNSFGAPGTPSDGIYMLYLREAHSGYSGAGTSASVKQSVKLPAGDYNVTVDSKCVASASYDGTVTLVAGDHSKNIGIGLTSIPEDWTTTSLTFSLDAETEVTLGVEIAYSGDAGLSVLLDNFKLYSAEEIEEKISWTMTTAGWGTMILPFATSIPEGLTAYAGDALTLDEDDSTITVGEAATSITANTPYLVKGNVDEDTDYTFTGTPTNTAETYTEGLLTGTLVDLAVATGAAFATDGTQYLLQNQGDGATFYPIIAESSSEATLDAYHCYLTIEGEDAEASPAKLSIVLPGAGEETGIVAVEGAETLANDAIYDLSGRRVAKAVKGVYIQNGKKVLVK